MGQIISFSNQKGGVGKTTTCINIASALGMMGKKILLVDYDPQGNTTSGVGIDKRGLSTTVCHVIRGETPLRDAILPTAYRGISILPTTMDLAGAEIDLASRFTRETNPIACLLDVKYDYDYILIDCPPSLGFLTVSALSVSDGVLVPMQCEFYALEGLSQLIPNLRRVRENYNASLQLVGILPTMYNGRLTLTRQVIAEIKRYYPNKLFRTPISRSVRLSEAPGFGKPIHYLDPRSRSAAEYTEAAEELMRRI